MPRPPPDTVQLYYALQQVGLLKIEITTDQYVTSGKKKKPTRRLITWLPAAYLAPPTEPVEHVELSDEDEADLEGFLT
jgi:hypothetical protein